MQEPNFMQDLRYFVRFSDNRLGPKFAFSILTHIVDPLFFQCKYCVNQNNFDLIGRFMCQFKFHK